MVEEEEEEEGRKKDNRYGQTPLTLPGI